MKRHHLSPHQRAVLQSHAARMRHQPTPSEERLWRALSSGKLGASFRRQVPIGKYIGDFVASEVHLVVEVDGPYHERRCAADERRERALGRAGYRVVRVSAEDVMTDLDAVVARIRRKVRG